jgi:hypothetical protein
MANGIIKIGGGSVWMECDASRFGTSVVNGKLRCEHQDPNLKISSVEITDHQGLRRVYDGSSSTILVEVRYGPPVT